MANNILTEGLRREDLKDFVSEVFTVDHYKSKMGEDRDVVVIGFRVKEKYPAIDLMEFIEAVIQPERLFNRPAEINNKNEITEPIINAVAL